MLGVFLARVWRLINRNQSHQAANAMATPCVTMTLHVSCHSLPGSAYGVCMRGCRDPYHGVSKNCLSINSMNRRFSALSPFGA
ncbi:hypothetical protein OAN307_c02580 [Octadecabacter antarcticus 307]|uniref:Uncharacterized protein n=1 Tax=Octadecabacter antarcticus 307 TaxID=391626 RepID=M9R2P7_9RHOB|nr:hypothetical protein OAN307_c02580 [Octadecabacter antarcticus 307]